MMCDKNKLSESKTIKFVKEYGWMILAFSVMCALIALLACCKDIKLTVDRNCCKVSFIASIALWFFVSVGCNHWRNKRIKSCTTGDKTNNNSDVLECWWDHICQVFSFDYAYAKIKKNQIPKYARAYYIKKANHINLIVSLVCVVICWVLVKFVKSDYCWLILSFFVLARMISRTMEINISFFKDIFSDEKNSTLTNYARIKLAVFSLCEEAILFSFIYYAFGNCEESVFDSVLLGMSSFIMSNGGDFDGNPFLKIIAIYQVISAVILITMSIANYLSLTKPANKSCFEILEMENDIGSETFQTNTIETYSKNDYDLYYTDDGYVEYLIQKHPSTAETNNEENDKKHRCDVIFTRVLYKDKKLNFSQYIKEIQNKTQRTDYNFILANGALKTAIGTKRIFIPRTLEFKKCSFARLFTLTKVKIEDEKEREYYSDKKWWK